ncbi:MAG: ABC transporter permease [Spirochaetaceae bacterium]|jgi:osmoprotectant transport system permease protein|nr:ABC transporter permease [Spirochaetaceae bacterium]
MIEYFLRYHRRLTDALLQHITLVGIVLIISVICAFAITFLVMHNKRLSNTVVRVFGVVYSIPSLALFAVLIPVLGIGIKTAVVVLVLYNQFLLIRNFLSGFNSVDPVIIEAASGMGMTRLQILLKITLPLSIPAIFAGIHLASVSTIGIATIAAVINAGGIGTILFDGLRTLNTVKIVWGTILAGGLAIGTNAILGLIEKKLSDKQ